jgi:DHA2 family multidrug resistance protein-like MFS transporter
VAVGGALPTPQGAAVTTAAQTAFVHGMQVTTGIGAVMLALGAVATLRALRGVPAVIDDESI